MKSPSDTTPLNTPRRVRNVALLIAAVLIIIMIILPLVVDDMMAWGFAAMVFLGFGAISAVVVAIFYSGTARLHDRVYGAHQWLAEWEYTEGEWQAFLRDERRRRQRNNWAIYRLIAIITAVVITVLTLMVQDLLMVVIGLALMAILLVPALLTPYTQTRKMTRERIVRVSKDALTIGGWFRPFTGNMISLRRAALEQGASSQQLVIELSAPTLTGEQEESFVIPLPPRHVASAQAVIKELHSRSHDQ